jgi:hypothetical protein
MDVTTTDTASTDTSAEATDSTETTDVSEQENESTPQVKEEPKAPAPKYRFKLKVDKEEKEAEYDHETAQRLIQKGLGADKRFNEVQHKLMELERREERLKDANYKLSDKQARRQALRDMGIDPAAFAEELLMEELEQSALTPEQRRIKELEDFKSMKELEEKTLREHNENLKQQQEYKKAVDSIDQEITKVLQSEGIEKNLETVERVLQHMRAAHAVGHDISVQEIVEKLKESQHKTLKSFVSNKKIDELAALLGEDALKQLNDHYLSKRTGKQAVSGGVRIVQKQSADKITDPHSFFKSL